MESPGPVFDPFALSLVEEIGAHHPTITCESVSRCGSPLSVCGSRSLHLLLSQSARHLVAGSGITFAEREPAELKGIPGTWRLYAVEGL